MKIHSIQESLGHPSKRSRDYNCVSKREYNVTKSVIFCDKGTGGRRFSIILLTCCCAFFLNTTLCVCVCFFGKVKLIDNDPLIMWQSSNILEHL
jgi:hypothetical protein